MAEVLLTQAVNQAEEAIESGNYGGAIETCQRILGQFPEFAGAHRIMAEAYAEQGDLEAARDAFQRTLERDPQSIPAHLGLGMLAEEAGDQESALAYFQVAWEIDPRRRDLREHVSRISQQLYGSDGRLYLTRAALASLHFHAGRWDRAVTETAQVLQDYASRIDVQVRLTEALWRRGDDSQAKQVSNTILKSLPSAVVPLLILADVHRREGDQATAQRYLQQARDIDPDGVRAADLIIVGFDDQADFLAVDDIPTFDEQLVHEEPARYAPAPDFSATQDTDELPPIQRDADREDVVVPDPVSQPQVPEMPTASQEAPAVMQPFRWEDVGDEDLEVSDLDHGTPPPQAPQADEDLFSLLSDEELDQARPGADSSTGYTNVLDSLDAAGMEPFDPTGGSDTTASQRREPPQPSSESPRDDMVLPSEEELEGARPSEERERGYTSMLDSLEAEGMEPFDPTGASQQRAHQAQPEPEPAPHDDMTLPSEEEIEQARPTGEREPGFTGVLDSLEAEGMEPFDPLGEQSDDSTDQSAASSAEDVDDWFSEFSLPSDEELDQAKPEEQRPAGFTGMLDSLDAEGMQPFDPDQSDAGPEPAASPPPVEPEDAGDATISLDDLGHDDSFELDWSQIDQEIEEARPGEMPRGYTDQLRTLDDHGLEPFSFEEPDAQQEAVPEPEPEKPESDELDLDQMTAGWEAESAGEPDPVDEDMDSIGVMFGDDQIDQFTETEPLRPEMLYEGLVSETPSMDSSEEESGWLEGETAADQFIDMASDIDDLSTDTDTPSVSDPMPVVPRETPLANVSAERLGLDAELIQRAREMKRDLIEQGMVGGSTPLPGTETDDSSALRKVVEQNPADIEQRIALAQSLMASSPDEALEHYRWVYRNAPERSSEVVRDLSQLIDIMREREVGVHRLLGALYRRGGDWAAAASHYGESLTYQRGSSNR